jgi:catechol 2,3-dioxygenase-like lactoylglutathione lyase family enzyme
MRRRELPLSIKRVVPDLGTDRMDESREFYIQVFGFEVTMDLGWIVTLASPDNPTAQINLLRRTGPSDSQNAPDLTIEVTDVDAVHDIAVERGLEVVYPLTDEEWGVRRFFVTDPDGLILNVMSHMDGPPA